MGRHRLVALNKAARRVYVRDNLRVHHGLVGALLVVIGTLLAFHDRRDFPWHVHDR